MFGSGECAGRFLNVLFALDFISSFWFRRLASMSVPSSYIGGSGGFQVFGRRLRIFVSLQTPAMAYPISLSPIRVSMRRAPDVVRDSVAHPSLCYLASRRRYPECVYPFAELRCPRSRQACLGDRILLAASEKTCETCSRRVPRRSPIEQAQRRQLHKVHLWRRRHSGEAPADAARRPAHLSQRCSGLCTVRSSPVLVIQAKRTLITEILVPPNAVLRVV